MYSVMVDFLIGAVTGAFLMYCAMKNAATKAERERQSHETTENCLSARVKRLEEERCFREGWDTHSKDDEGYIESLLRENDCLRSENSNLRKEIQSSLMFADTFSKGGSVKVTAVRRCDG